MKKNHQYIEILKKQIENIPEKKEIIRLNENLNVLKLEKKSISLFKREERKEIQEKINTVNKEILEITKKIKNVSSEIEQKIDSMKIRIDEINMELTRER